MDDSGITSGSEHANQRARNHWRALKKGEAAALEMLFRLFYTMLFDYGIKFCGKEELVKDCIQDTFAYIWEKRTKLSVPVSVKAYLLIAMRRNVLKSLDRKARYERTHKEYGVQQPQSAFSAEELLISQEVAEHDLRKLKRGFDAIPERMREALYLKTFNGLNYKQISEIMEISPQVARNYVSESMKHLRTNWAE